MPILYVSLEYLDTIAMQSHCTLSLTFIWILSLPNVGLSNGDLIPIDVPQNIYEQIRQLVIPHVPAPMPHQVVGGGEVGLMLTLTLQVLQGEGETQFETHINAQPPIQEPQLPDQVLTQVALTALPALQHSGLLQGAAKVILIICLMPIMIPVSN